MPAKKQILLTSSIFILPFTLGLFQLLTAILGAKTGYLAGFLFYWIYAICTVWLVTNFDWHYFKNIIYGSNHHKYSLILNILAFFPIIGVFFISFLPNVARLTLSSAVLLVFMALLNGTIEELYWRGLFAIEYKNNWAVGFLASTLLFGAWHISLWFSRGITFQGGFAALVGGAYMMGLLWTWVTRSVGNIRACTIAHILVNLFAFTGLFVENGF